MGNSSPDTVEQPVYKCRISVFETTMALFLGQQIMIWKQVPTWHQNCIGSKYFHDTVKENVFVNHNNSITRWIKQP